MLGEAAQLVRTLEPTPPLRVLIGESPPTDGGTDGGTDGTDGGTE